MAECVNCGRTLSDVARFCPDCGTHVQATAVTQADPPETAAAAPAAEAPAEQAAAAPVEPAEPAATITAEPVATVTAEAPTASATVDPPVSPDADAPESASTTCAACGTSVPDGDLFCGDCGAPMSATVASAAPVAPAAPPQAPPASTMAATAATAMPADAPPYQLPGAPVPGPGPMAYGAQAGYRPSGGSGDYFSFGALFVETSAVPLFWIAEGVNLFYWIMNWVVTYRWSGAQGFFLAAGGFILFAVVIRIVMEAAVAASRAGKG